MKNYFIDVGGSQTRVIEGKGSPKIFESTFTIIPEKSKPYDTIKDRYSACAISFKGETTWIAKGEAMNYYGDSILTCDNNVLKADFIGTYLNIIYVIARDLAENPNKDDDINVHVCLPPAEKYSQIAPGESATTEERFKAHLNAIIDVDFFLAGKQISFMLTESNIHTYPEGLVSVTNIHDPKMLQKVSDTTVAFIDIGYRSTDISVTRKGMPYQGSFDTAPFGGINLEASLKSMFDANAIFKSPDDVKHMLETGIMYDGSRSVPVGDYVKAVKKPFAESIRNRLVQVLNTRGLNLSAINYFVPIGRPFKQTGQIGTPTDGGDLKAILSNMLGIEYISVDDGHLSNVLGMQAVIIDEESVNENNA